MVMAQILSIVKAEEMMLLESNNSRSMEGLSIEHLSPYLEVQSLKELYKSHPHCCDFAPLV